MVEKETNVDDSSDNTSTRLETLEKQALSSTSPDSEEIDEIPYETQKVKLRWSRVFLIATILTIILTGISVLIIWRVSINREQVILFSPMFFFIECGLLLIFGGCIGTIKQSFTIDYIKVKLMKGEKSHESK